MDVKGKLPEFSLHTENQTNLTYVSQIVNKWYLSILNLKQDNSPNELMEIQILGKLSMNSH